MFRLRAEWWLGLDTRGCGGQRLRPRGDGGIVVVLVARPEAGWKSGSRGASGIWP